MQNLIYWHFWRPFCNVTLFVSKNVSSNWSRPKRRRRNQFLTHGDIFVWFLLVWGLTWNVSFRTFEVKYRKLREKVGFGTLVGFAVLKCPYEGNKIYIYPFDKALWPYISIFNIFLIPKKLNYNTFSKKGTSSFKNYLLWQQTVFQICCIPAKNKDWWFYAHFLLNCFAPAVASWIQLEAIHLWTSVKSVNKSCFSSSET
jgi:hypothetical protein